MISQHDPRPHQSRWPSLPWHRINWNDAFWGFGAACEAYFRSLLLIVFIALLRALYQPIPDKRSPVGRLLSKLLRPAPVRCRTALDVASPSSPVLQWRTNPKRQPYRKRKPYSGGACLGPWTKVMLVMCGLTSAPTCVWAVPEDAKPFLHAAWHISLTPPETSAHLSPDPIDSAQDASREGATEPLPQTHALQDKYRGGWLGVAIYAPYFPTTAFAMRVSPGSSTAHVCQLVRDSNRCPCVHHDGLVEVYPQVYSGYLSLLSFPTIISQGHRPHVAVVIDLTRVGGACYAATLPCDARLDDLWKEVGAAMHVDIESEPVQVWIADASFPASHLGTLSVSHGTLITVCRPITDRPVAPVPFYAADLLLSSDNWEKVEHMPRPSSAHCLAVGFQTSLNPIVLAFFPRFFKQRGRPQSFQTDGRSG